VTFPFDAAAADGTLEPAAARLLQAELQKVTDLRQHLGQVLHDVLPESSDRYQETQTYLGRLSYDHAMRALSTALDHLISWERLLLRARVQPETAHLSLLRSVLENAMTAFWLLEGGPHTRLSRGAQVAADDLRERHKFEREFAGPSPAPSSTNGKSAEERLVDLTTRAAAAGLTQLKRQQQMIPPPLPLIEMFQRYPVTGRGTVGRGDAWLYRMLSAAAHGKQWLMLTQPLQQIAFGVVPAGGPSDGVTVRSTANSGITVLSTQAATAAVERGLARLAELGQAGS